MYDVLRTLQRGARYMWVAVVVVLAVVLVIATLTVIGADASTGRL